jgi:hypothetical protein
MKNIVDLTVEIVVAKLNSDSRTPVDAAGGKFVAEFTQVVYEKLKAIAKDNFTNAGSVNIR